MSSKGNALKSTALTVSIKETTKNAGVLKLVDKALRGAKSMVQSIRESAKIFDEAAKACAEHAKQHGDVMPAHRLVMGLRELNHGATDTLSNELVAWFRSHSQIDWDAKKQPYQNEKKTYEESYETTESFEDMDTVKRARAAANRAGNATLAAADTKMLLGRIYGIRNWYKRLAEGKDARSLSETDAKTMLRIINAVEEAAVEAAPKKVVAEMEKKAA